MNQPMIQLKLAHLITPIQINLKMSKHHLMNNMEVKILILKNLKQQLYHLKEMNVLTFNILSNLFKKLL